MVLHSLRSTFMQRQRKRPFIQRGKEAGQKGSGNGMPYAGNGADDGRFRCGSKLGGGGCQIGGKTGVLHTDFDGDGSFFGCVHSGKFSCAVTEKITKAVME